MLQRGGAAIVDLIDAIIAAREAGADAEALKPALQLQRRAQWRLDYIAAENSMGFHAPQEAARILGEAVDYARQGQVAALRAMGGEAAAAAEPASDGKPPPTDEKPQPAQPLQPAQATPQPSSTEK